MPHTIPNTALDVTVAVRWGCGDRTFNMALTHEAIVNSSTGDALLANKLQEKIKVPFLYWQRLEVQLTYIWTSGQSQVIYSNVSEEDHRKSQEQVIELLSMWQQHACVEPRTMRMILTLDIDPAGVHLLPSRSKLPSLTHGRPRESADTRHSASSPVGTLKASVSPEKECDEVFKTIHYESPTGVDSSENSDGDPVLDSHIAFDRSEGNWNKLLFTRTKSS